MIYSGAQSTDGSLWISVLMAKPTRALKNNKASLRKKREIQSRHVLPHDKIKMQSV